MWQAVLDLLAVSRGGTDLILQFLISGYDVNPARSYIRNVFAQPSWV